MDPVTAEVRRDSEEVDPVIVEVRGGKEEVDSVRGVGGGQRGGGPCYGGIEGSSEEVYPVMRGQRGAARRWTL